MKRSGTQVVLLTLLSSVAAVKFHDAMVVLKPTPAPDKGEFNGKGSPEEENQLSTILQGMDLDSSGDLDLNELGESCCFFSRNVHTEVTPEVSAAGLSVINRARFNSGSGALLLL